jgi:glycosyltransferase involved in cell wall biosynthesis
MIIKPKDANSIAEAVTVLLENEKMFGEIAVNAENFIKSNYSLDMMASRYEKVYFEILGG